MKYNDKSTERWQKRQLEKNDSKSERAQRREEKRNLNKFGVRVCGYVDRDWWESFTQSEQKSIYNSWLNSRNEWTYRPTKYTVSEPKDVDFGKWIKKTYSEIKPDKSIYRDKKIDRILSDI